MRKVKKNKKNKKVIFLLIIFVAFVFIGGYLESHYTRKNCTITKVENGEIIVSDIFGFEWSFEGENFSVGDKVKLKMFDNFTSSIEDDEIVKVEKI